LAGLMLEDQWPAADRLRLQGMAGGGAKQRME
jgi:hypothetical protein